MASTFELITQGLTNIINYINPFSDDFILKGVLNFLGSILNYINPFSDDFILKGVLNFLGNILSYINPFSENFLGKKIIELLADLLEFLFVPSKDFFADIQEIVKSKFAFIDSVKIGMNSLKNIINNINSVPTLSIHINSTKFSTEQNLKIIDLNWYTPFKSYGDLVLTAVIYAFYFIRLSSNLPNIIRGVGNSGSDIININDFKGGN